VDPWIERTGARTMIDKGGMPADDYKNVMASAGAIHLTTVGYGTGALLGRGKTREWSSTIREVA